MKSSNFKKFSKLGLTIEPDYKLKVEGVLFWNGKEYISVKPERLKLFDKLQKIKNC